MPMSPHARLAIAAGVLSLATAGATAAIAPARAATPSAATPSAATPSAAARPAAVVAAVSTSYTVRGALCAVAATSAANAWAVGATSNAAGTVTKVLILHWNGRKWSPVTVPGVSYGALYALSVVTADNVWAVGSAGDSTGNSTGLLLVHWNGKAWHRVTDVPSYLQSSQAVSATAQGAWVATSTSFATVFLNLASSGWYIVPILFPAQTNKVYSHEIWGVEVVSPSLAWAGGLTQAINGDLSGGLLLQRKDSVWKTVADPMPDMAIIGMALGPHGIVWAVGYSLGSAYRAESMRWDGKAWQKVPISVPRHSLLTAVVSASGGTWAVGAVESSTTTRMLIEHWTGSSWTRVAAPAAASSELRAVAVTSAHAAWAVGVGSGKTLILHWNGKSWS